MGLTGLVFKPSLVLLELKFVVPRTMLKYLGLKVFPFEPSVLSLKLKFIAASHTSVRFQRRRAPARWRYSVG